MVQTAAPFPLSFSPYSQGPAVSTITQYTQVLGPSSPHIQPPFFSVSVHQRPAESHPSRLACPSRASSPPGDTPRQRQNRPGPSMSTVSPSHWTPHSARARVANRPRRDVTGRLWPGAGQGRAEQSSKLCATGARSARQKTSHVSREAAGAWVLSGCAPSVRRQRLGCLLPLLALAAAI